MSQQNLFPDQICLYHKQEADPCFLSHLRCTFKVEEASTGATENSPEKLGTYSQIMLKYLTLPQMFIKNKKSKKKQKITPGYDLSVHLNHVYCVDNTHTHTHAACHILTDTQILHFISQTNLYSPCFKVKIGKYIQTHLQQQHILGP